MPPRRPGRSRAPGRGWHGRRAPGRRAGRAVWPPGRRPRCRGEPGLGTLEHRLRLGMDRRENHVATDAEVAAELAVTQSRTLGRLEERLRLAESAAQRGAVHDIEAAWALAEAGGIVAPGRIVVDHGDQGPVALTLAALGHEGFAPAAEDPPGPVHQRPPLLASLDEALTAAGPVDAVVVLSPQS